MNIKCIIVDDEELAQNVLEKYISQFPSLDLIQKCNNAIEAISFIYENEVDLIFLDINMPELSGLDMLKTLNKPPKVILTTAYSEYAVESYEYAVVDYLLKPISFERFVKAVNKAIEYFSVKDETTEISQIDKENYIFIKQDSTTYRINFSDILYVEGCGNYIKLITTDKQYIVRETMQEYENKLPSDQFMRVHKSYIVSLSKIDNIKGNVIQLGPSEIPIGTIYKMELQKRIGMQRK